MDSVATVFPGADQPTQPTTNMPCLLMHVRIMVVYDDVAYMFKVDPEGLEIGSPIKQEPAMGHEFLWHSCSNCGLMLDGNESFDAMRAHLGRRNPVLTPFGGVMPFSGQAHGEPLAR